AIPVAVYLGTWAGWNPVLHGLFFPLARFLSPIPPLVYSPFLVALSPTFQAASLAMLILGIFFPVFLNVMFRLENIEDEILIPARMLELSDVQMVHCILLPYILPNVLTFMKGILTSAFMILNFAEMMGATSGLGFYVRYFADYGNYAKVLAGIILSGSVILCINKLMSILETKLIPWRR
ncbi:MAG TPA: ABC transporter permease subunit, partial [Clostridiaceae bacterium]|nr:ABC transporter permease subunit [Clostridiaceae bacterium]